MSARRKRPRLGIVMPFKPDATPAVAWNVQLWKELAPCQEMQYSKDVTMLFLSGNSDEHWGKEHAGDIVKALEESNASRCFKEIIFASRNISKGEDIYVQSAFGWRAGINRQWWRFFTEPAFLDRSLLSLHMSSVLPLSASLPPVVSRSCVSVLCPVLCPCLVSLSCVPVVSLSCVPVRMCHTSHPFPRRFDYVFWMDPDAAPVQPRWAQRLYEEVLFWPDYGFWMKGSAHRGHIEDRWFSEPYIINGNALYNLHHPGFAKYRQFLQQVIHTTTGATGTDEDLDRWFFDGWLFRERLSKVGWAEWGPETIGYFVYSSFVYHHGSVYSENKVLHADDISLPSPKTLNHTLIFHGPWDPRGWGKTLPKNVKGGDASLKPTDLLSPARQEAHEVPCAAERRRTQAALREVQKVNNRVKQLESKANLQEMLKMTEHVKQLEIKLKATRQRMAQMQQELQTCRTQSSPQRTEL